MSGGHKEAHWAETTTPPTTTPDHLPAPPLLQIPEELDSWIPPRAPSPRKPPLLSLPAAFSQERKTPPQYSLRSAWTRRPLHWKDIIECLRWGPTRLLVKAGIEYVHFFFYLAFVAENKCYAWINFTWVIEMHYVMSPQWWQRVLR